ncbi:MAG TPA: hemolysin III family protein [Bacilli bacterium]|jgi:hemolysin III|nr:hemolysin III family protein [Bacilli bacterium]
MELNRRKRKQTIGEEIANAISHGVSGLFGIAGLVLLIVKADNGGELASAIVFGLGMIFLYTMSALYHAFAKDGITKRVFKRFDHISIYVLIGATFAPVFILVIDKPLGWILLGVQWAIITFGIVFKAVKIHKFQVIHIVSYLLLGWSALGLFGPLYQLSAPAFWLILAGGVSYTIGVFFYATKLFKFSHFVWHLFVFGGTLCHFFAIFLFIF